jgi:hypothetical protein
MKTITLIFISLFLFSCEGNIQVSTQPKEKPIGIGCILRTQAGMELQWYVDKAPLVSSSLG